MENIYKTTKRQLDVNTLTVKLFLVTKVSQKMELQWENTFVAKRFLGLEKIFVVSEQYYLD